MTTCIGIDIAVAKPPTMAVEMGGLWLVKSISMQHHKLVLFQLERMRKAWSATHVAIEKPYLAERTNKAGQRKQLISIFGELSEVYGQIKLLCLQAGFKKENIIPALPMVWMPAMLAQDGYMPKGPDAGKERKHRSVMRAHSMGVPGCDPAKRVKGDDDVADAACIAEWGGIQVEAMERMRVGDGSGDGI